MGKLAKYLSYIVEGNLDYIPEDSANLLANESKRLCVEFAKWTRLNGWDMLASDDKYWMKYDDMGIQLKANPVEEDKLFDIFLEQKKF